MRRSWDVRVPVVDRRREAIEKLFELSGGDQRCIGAIIGETYARIWWVSLGLEWRVRWVMASELNQIRRLHDSATGSVP